MAAQLAGAQIAQAGSSVLNSLNGSMSSGGSVNSAYNYNRNVSDSYANTNGTVATERAKAAAAIANASAKDAWKDAADFNAKQAAAQRAWEEYMSNTQYQRAVADMRAAGINPILAASNGISGASVGSGASASIGTANTFQSQTFADQNSASHSEGYGEGYSSGSSWENSESGLATGLKLMADSIESTLSALNSSQTIKIMLDTAKKWGIGGLDGNNNPMQNFVEQGAKSAYQGAKNLVKSIYNFGKKSIQNEAKKNSNARQKVLKDAKSW